MPVKDAARQAVFESIDRDSLENSRILAESCTDLAEAAGQETRTAELVCGSSL